MQMLRYSIPKQLKPAVLRSTSRPKPTRVRASTDIVTISHYVGESITLFVAFYCGLQWLHYKEMVDELEKKKKK